MKEIVACLIMEQTSEPATPKILNVIKQQGVEYVRFRSCLQDFGVFNRNNRNYFLAPMKEAWEDDHIRELMANNTFFGENGHPCSNDPKRVVSIDPNNCCHRIVDKEFIGNSVYGIIETLNDYNGPGHKLMGHVLQGAKTAFSLRALAPITKVDKNRGEIRSKPRIITYDRVILPSHRVAYQTDDGITMIHESADLSVATPTHNDLCIPVSANVMESLGDFLLEESKEVKSFVDIFDVNYESVSLDKTGNNLILQESVYDNSRRTFVVSMESYVRDQVSDILRKL